MTEQMKPGDAVLVRATFEDHKDAGTWAWVTIDGDVDMMPGGDSLVRRASLTTEEAIWNAAIKKAAEVAKSMSVHTGDERALRESTVEHVMALLREDGAT